MILKFIRSHEYAWPITIVKEDFAKIVSAEALRSLVVAGIQPLLPSGAPQ
jgi:hypothetical protein